VAVRDPLPEVPVERTDFRARFTTAGSVFLVDLLEVEFYGGRRGKHHFLGFYRDQYDQMVQVPFSDLTRIDFVGQMDKSLFDQAVFGREELGLQLNNAFELRLTYRDQRQEEFFAFIPKFRGEKDFTIWEFPLDSSQRQILWIEFE
jgi:hypothetical protein